MPPDTHVTVPSVEECAVSDVVHEVPTIEAVDSGTEDLEVECEVSTRPTSLVQVPEGQTSGVQQASDWQPNNSRPITGDVRHRDTVIRQPARRRRNLKIPSIWRPPHVGPSDNQDAGQSVPSFVRDPDFPEPSSHTTPPPQPSPLADVQGNQNAQPVVQNQPKPKKKKGRNKKKAANNTESRPGTPSSSHQGIQPTAYLAGTLSRSNDNPRESVLSPRQENHPCAEGSLRIPWQRNNRIGINFTCLEEDDVQPEQTERQGSFPTPDQGSDIAEPRSPVEKKEEPGEEFEYNPNGNFRGLSKGFYSFPHEPSHRWQLKQASDPKLVVQVDECAAITQLKGALPSPTTKRVGIPTPVNRQASSAQSLWTHPHRTSDYFDTRSDLFPLTNNPLGELEASSSRFRTTPRNSALPQPGLSNFSQFQVRRTGENSSTLSLGVSNISHLSASPARPISPNQGTEAAESRAPGGVRRKGKEKAKAVTVAADISLSAEGKEEVED
ncbi:hypothetical protein MMYC01_203958 [Madurella mycetomatis]|uniref:Uncharacterized protein n=1 Tax=Madurella mycetomatis TaxID=100816 RepID=A0A175W6A0_9PEZI|nr:hypothetical protein MMYC01_203958 [Madurella mycetomatis]